MKTTHFAAVANGVVYGFGTTSEEATQDALQFGDDEADTEMTVVPCTNAAHQYIQDYGFRRGEVIVERSIVRLHGEIV